MLTKQQWLVTSTLALGLSLSAQAATVVTFEDISPNDLTNRYAGITGWTSMGSVGIADKDLGGNGLKAFYGQQGQLRFEQAPVVFEGVYYKAYAVPQDAFPLSAIELWYQGNLVYSLQYSSATRAMEWMSSGYNGLVDTLYIRGGLSGFAIDDLTYRTASAVPLPASWALFAGGASLLGLARRRFA